MENLKECPLYFYSRDILGPYFLGISSGRLYISSGIHSYFHEYIGHYLLGNRIFGLKPEYKIVNGQYLNFTSNLKLLQTNLQSGLRSGSITKFLTNSLTFENLKIFKSLFKLDGECSISMTKNFYNKTRHPLFFYSWSILSGPLADSIKYNLILSLGISSIKEGRNQKVEKEIKNQQEDQFNYKYSLGVFLIGFSYHNLLAHYNYCGLHTGYNVKTFLRNFKNGHDIERYGYVYSKACGGSPFSASLLLRSSFTGVIFTTMITSVFILK